MRLSVVIALLTVAACGADGPPIRPGPEPAISVTGEAAIGMTTRIN